MKKNLMTLAVMAVAAIFGAVLAFAEGEPQKTPVVGDAGPAEAAGPSEGLEITLKGPLFSPHFATAPLAVVNDEAITVNDLRDALASSHDEGGEEDMHARMTQTAKKIDLKAILERLINVRLISQEGRHIGLDELEEVKESVDKYSKAAQRDLLVQEIQKDAKADDAEVEKLYRDVIKEWRIKSVVFGKEENAKKMEEELKAGKSFDELAADVLDKGLAEGKKESGYVKTRDLQPEIAGIISQMEVNAVSSIIKVGEGRKTGYAIVKLEEVRFPDDPKAMERAKDAVLEYKKNEAVKDFKRDAIKKDVNIDFKLIRGLDYEAAKPGIEKLSKDKRVIVRIRDDKPITVADLTQAMKDRFFHGMKTAIESKKVNSSKLEVLDEMVEKRIFKREIAKRSLDQSEEFRKKVRAYEDSVIFGYFVKKVMLPDVKVSEEEMKTYYTDHVKDFTYPEMMKLDNLVFGKLSDAESSLEKLKQGADFKWMKANVEGQVPKDTQGLLSYEGSTLLSDSLPEGVRKALAGATPGEYRMYESPEGHVYVLYVQDLAPSRQEAFENVKNDISRKLFSEKLNKSVEDWAAKLKETADIRRYLADTGNEEGSKKAN